MFIMALCWGRPDTEALAMKLGQKTQRNKVPSREKIFEGLEVASWEGWDTVSTFRARLTPRPKVAAKTWTKLV